jgi:hypothetical protein
VANYQYPPPPRSGSRVFTIVFSAVVALIVVCSGIFIVSRFTGGSDDSAGAATTPSESRTTAPSPTTTPTAPPAPAACRGCIPGLSVDVLTKRLKAKGFSCKDDRILGMRCEKGGLEVGLSRVYKTKNQVESIDVGGRASGSGNYPQGPREAWAALQAGLPGILPLFIPDATARQQIVAFAAKNTNHAATGPAAVKETKLDDYRLSCHGISGATVGKNGRSSSSYSTSVDIYSASM